ncbi:hypothetical protein ACDQ55_08430 [Chitinophaga sp. 30R24]|uniref:hypothetical protein n=1 Tax=Chitinophaga sp. 30R24 TaxID=3248838 RepID=UPI003B9190E9
MKQLDLKSEAYRYIVQSYGEWLSALGYNEQTVYQLPNHIQELLYYAEGKGYAGLHQLDIHLFKDHYYKLKGRSNQRRGGGLSNSYLNKHLQALQKFSDYLRQSGRLLLPRLDIRTESDEGIITDVSRSKISLQILRDYFTKCVNLKIGSQIDNYILTLLSKIVKKMIKDHAPVSNGHGPFFLILRVKPGTQISAQHHLLGRIACFWYTF